MARQWDEARGNRCAFDTTHAFKTGDRVWTVTIAGTIRKEYCPDCDVARWGAPPDTGEITDARDDLAHYLGRTDTDETTTDDRTPPKLDAWDTFNVDGFLDALDAGRDD